MSSVLKVGVFIPYHKMLTKYLGAVQECFSQWGNTVTMEFEYKIQPEEECRNMATKLFGDCDYIFTVDADEFITPEDQRKLIRDMQKTNSDGAFIRVVDYKDNDHIYEIREHKPIVVIKPHVEFWQGRCIRGVHNAIITEDVVLHHFGYAFDDKIMYWKNKNYWDQHNPKEIEQLMQRPVKEYDMPEEIRRLINV